MSCSFKGNNIKFTKQPSGPLSMACPFLELEIQSPSIAQAYCPITWQGPCALFYFFFIPITKQNVMLINLNVSIYPFALLSQS
jgi:hypothetical protein